MGAKTRTPVVWLTGSDDASRSAQRVKGALRAPVTVVPKDLEVWTRDPAEPYDLNTEVAAIEALADDRGWERLHLFGFSAGATVALATTLRLGPRVATVAARLHAVLPHVKATVFADESHLNAPHRKEPERVARLLEHLWSA